jgi:hypothetical protein
MIIMLATSVRHDLDVHVMDDAYTVKFGYDYEGRTAPKTRVYVAGESDPFPAPILEDFSHIAELVNRDRVQGMRFAPSDTLYTERGDFPEVDEAWDRHNKATIDAWRYHAVRVTNKLMALEIISRPADFKLNFSKHAGCTMCPCSPGLVVNGHVYHDTMSRTVTNLWITKH